MRICWKLLNGNHDCERKFHFITACRPHSHHYHRYSRLPRCFAFLCYAFDITSPSLSFYDTQKTTRAESCCVVAKNNLFDTQLRNGERKEFCGKLRNVWRRSYNKWQAIVKFQYRVNPKCVALFCSQILEWRPFQVQTMSCCWIKNFSVLSAGIWCWSKHSYECLRSNARTKKNKQFSQFSCHCLNSDKLEIFFHLTRNSRSHSHTYMSFEFKMSADFFHWNRASNHKLWDMWLVANSLVVFLVSSSHITHLFMCGEKELFFFKIYSHFSTQIMFLYLFHITTVL